MRRKGNSSSFLSEFSCWFGGERGGLSARKRAPTILCLRKTIVGLSFMLKMKLLACNEGCMSVSDISS
jgi:hypothetical protein